MGSKALSSFILILGCASSAWAQQQPTGSWSPESGGDTFYYGASVTDGTYLYLVGGYQYGAVTSYPYVMAQARRYDPVNNSWSTLPQMASGTVNGSALWGVRYHAGAFHGGRIFVFGGQVYSGTVGSGSYSTAYSNAIRAFDMSAQTWTTLGATLSSTRYYHAAATLGDRVYIAGGASSNVLEIFNPLTNTIAAGTPLPGYLYYHAMSAVPALNKVYAMGGYGVAGYSGINYEYAPEDNDPASNDVGGTWTTRANISNGSGAQQNLYYVAAITLNNRVYLPGGYSAQTGAINQTFEYNPFTNQWAQRQTMAYQHYRHGAVAINGKGYVYGGNSYPNVGEEFTPPNFGSAPFPPANVAQSGSRPESAQQSQADATLVDGWTNNQIVFSADVTDPDSGQQVRFLVQVKPQAAAWTQASAVTSLATPLGAQGAHTLTYNIPADGGYDWRWRVEDAFSNSHPETPGTWIEAFGGETSQNTVSPDFRSDQVLPADPVADEPHNVDIQVPDPVLGNVRLNWIESTDNGPAAGIQYEIQVSRDGGFNDIEAQLFSPAGTYEVTVPLTVSRYDKFWRVRARDIGGNLSSWSAPLNFRVTNNDGVNHSSGDAKKTCSFGVAAGNPVLWSAFLGVILLGLAASRRAHR